jgi:hypothetical protein
MIFMISTLYLSFRKLCMTVFQKSPSMFFAFYPVLLYSAPNDINARRMIHGYSLFYKK